MARTVDAQLWILAGEFAAELTALAKRTVLECVAAALTGELVATASRSATRRDASRDTEHPRQPAPAGPKPRRASRRSSPPLSLKAYEREVLSCAIAANGGDNLAAARKLGMTKSTFYRRVRVLGVDRSR